MNNKRDADNKAVIAFAKYKANELIGLLKKRYGGDKRVQMLLVNFTEVRMLPEYVNMANKRNNAQWLNGGARLRDGLIEIEPRNADGFIKPKSEVLRTLVHEIAHLMHSFDHLDNGHGATWANTMLTVTRIANTELGWGVRIPCYYCAEYRMCDPSTCRACTWECPQRMTPPPGSRQQVTPTVPFARFEPVAYSRVCQRQTPTAAWWKQLCDDYARTNFLRR